MTHGEFRVTAYLVVLLLTALIALTVAGIYSFRAATWTVLSPTINGNGENVSGAVSNARRYFQYSSNIDWIGLIIVVALILIMPLFFRAKWHEIGIAVLVALGLTVLIAIVGAILATIGAIQIRQAGNSSATQSFYNGIIAAFIGYAFFLAIIIIMAFIIFGYARKGEDHIPDPGENEYYAFDDM